GRAASLLPRRRPIFRATLGEPQDGRETAGKPPPAAPGCALYSPRPGPPAGDRMPQPAPDHLAFDDLVIDFAGRRLWRGGDERALEPKAFAVLALLAAAPGRVFTRDEILDAV